MKIGEVNPYFGLREEDPNVLGDVNPFESKIGFEIEILDWIFRLD